MSWESQVADAIKERWLMCWMGPDWMAHLWDNVALWACLDELAYQVKQGTRLDWLSRAGVIVPE